MANDIFVSDEYAWTASFGVFEWVVGFLLEAVEDAATREHLELVLSAGLGAVDLRRLPEAGRAQIMRALRGPLVPAAESSLALTQPEGARRFTIGHVKVLALMAEDVAGKGAI
ncbi:hypothetical protein ACFPOI_23530 [Nonomuraea angiospora]|uniref:Uncharacterized protein n=1 Tax=Nonomuraea angiospora TaxID=46172 RepID=A0ABR9ML83_9ACTN|nr:hypothetical protein [Nonomuraea angiospora]MBE1593647.1 hypothetical protein [Nonomuraea angiospora]MDX3099421.1 hypothetical protein [Nonomuraea angiospora]